MSLYLRRKENMKFTEAFDINEIFYTFAASIRNVVILKIQGEGEAFF